MRYFLTLITLFTFLSVKAQYKVGATIAAASGDVPDAYTTSFSIDGYYMFGNPDKFLKVGLTSSFLYYLGKEIDVMGSPVKYSDAPYLPLAGALRFTIFRVLTFGPDIGYGISLNNEHNSGAYWKAIIGLDFANAVEVNLFVTGISNPEGSGFNSAGLGFLIHIY